MRFQSRYNIVKKSGLFDERYYLEAYDDIRKADIDPIKHYLKHGWKEGRNPSEQFDTNFYLETYPDVKAARMNPLIHFIKFGVYEGRKTHSEKSLEQQPKQYSKLTKLIQVIKHVRQNPYLIKKFINETKNFGLKNAIKKVKAKSGIKSSTILTTTKPKCTFQYSGKDYDIKVSVIIPTYNRSKLLPSLIESWREVNKVTRYKYEIIFSDDGSEDGSVEILEAVKDLPIIVLKNNHGGAAKARNNAIRNAKGEKLYIIGDDIFPNPQIINQHYEKLKELPICKAVLGEIIWHKDLEINTLMKHITELGCEQFSFNAFPPYGYIDFRHFYTSNISIDREFLMSEKIIFDESFYKVNFEDIELGYRLSKKGMDIYFYPDAIAEHYHPYTSVAGFCRRQQIAGEMALVFKRLHQNEVEWVVQVEQISTEWKNYINHVSKLTFQKDFKILEQIIDLCQRLEDENLIQQYDLEKNVSSIYRVLFRFFYEKGVIENSYQIDDTIVQKVFAVFFIPQIQEYIKDIILITHLESIDFNTDFAEKNDVKIIIEVDNHISVEKLHKEYVDVMSDILIRIKSDAKELDDNYIYKPKSGFMLSVNSIKQAILFLKNNSVDSILFSFGLVDLPYIGISKDLENNIIYKNNGMSIEDFKSKRISGKVIRLISETYTTKLNIKELINQSVDDYGYWNKRNSGYIEEGIISYQSTPYQKNKKIVFVFPTFLAVGGVERNTAEIIEALKNEYDFVVVNFERLNEVLGSLHRQFTKTCLGVYDLTELSHHDGILNYLKILNQFYKPDLIWICNGSPWLEHNLSNIRSIFKSSAIVDQQVYDINEGWVRLYKEKNQNLLSFDGFIAINSRIKNIFTNDVNIDEKKVDLIYSVMSDEKRDKASNYTRNELLKKYNLNSDQKYITSIGRLAYQKAPLDLIHLIQKVVDRYGEEFKFIVVGSGELSTQVDQLIKKYNLERYIVRLDYVDNTYELHLIAEVIIFTSLYEGLSIALLEALSVGTPGISTDVGDLATLIRTQK
ncbi:glycosyltransferase [Sulfurospirillum sp. MES]|uniref:glycosyltransferase n=1 Tax=Sulfurospirillum sp. MES TaxID=1565314 RepID=UPI0005427179|nr:glycosyltransferase [Sulfurospirillum sp. MES]KHG32924.1 MAG: hypothetical protein OA34_12735 [Sulfurospirillum sp. MES]